MIDSMALCAQCGLPHPALPQAGRTRPACSALLSQLAIFGWLLRAQRCVMRAEGLSLFKRGPATRQRRQRRRRKAVVGMPAGRAELFCGPSYQRTVAPSRSLLHEAVLRMPPWPSKLPAFCARLQPSLPCDCCIESFTAFCIAPEARNSAAAVLAPRAAPRPAPALWEIAT